MRRVFFLGNGKTGTSTLGRTMKSVGLGSMHHGPWCQWANDHNKKAYENCPKSTFNGGKVYDWRRGTFFDLKWLYETFPNSFYVLNSRNLKGWLVSWWNHENRKSKVMDEMFLTKNTYYRNTWHSKVVEFFKDKPNFCTLDLGSESKEVILEKLSKATDKKVSRLLNNNIAPRKHYVKNPEIVQRVLEKMNITPDQYDLLFIENLSEK